jgi:U3 small nucleolar RNA-associated protein 12
LLQGPVTAVRFIECQNVVVSASKDTYVKFWDLSNQHCFKTLAGHVTEVWDLVLAHQDSLLITGGADMELRQFICISLFKLKL